MSKIHTNPGHLRKSGNKLSDFGSKLASGGEKLESAGQNLVSHASGDKSGFGAVISKAMGRGVQITGKVFGEGGRVVEVAGKRLGKTADLHEGADDHGAGLLKKLHPDAKVKASSHGGSRKPSSKPAAGGKDKAVGHLPVGKGGETTHLSGDLINPKSVSAQLPDILKKHGVSQSEFDSMRHRMNQPGGTNNVTAEEAQKFRKIREDIPLKAGTPVQKVLNPWAAEHYLGNSKEDGFDPKVAKGCFARAADAEQMRTPAELHSGLRLDFKDSPFSEDMDKVHVLRTSVERPEDYPIPFGGPNPEGAQKIGGKNVWGEPFTGDGFTGSDKYLVPEWDRQETPLRNGDTMRVIQAVA
jgi:hypothetical protein